MADLNDDKQARRDLAEMYRKYKKPIPIPDAPAGISLGDLNRLIKSHEKITRQECVSAFIGLLARNRCLMNLPAQKVRELIEESVGIKSEAAESPTAPVEGPHV